MKHSLTTKKSISKRTTAMMKNRKFGFTIIIVSTIILTIASGYKNGNPKDTKTLVKDIDKNVYRTITIGSQTWMAENLKTTRFNDGTPIANVAEDSTWGSLSTPAYCWFDNDAKRNKNKYGAMYNWYAVQTSKLCPTGWHVPTESEFVVLEDFLIANGSNYDSTTTYNKIAKALADKKDWTESKSQGAVGNLDYPTVRNSTGFSAKGAGCRSINGGFDGLGELSFWWSSTKKDDSDPIIWMMHYDLNYVQREIAYKKGGNSVRCLKN